MKIFTVIKVINCTMYYFNEGLQKESRPCNSKQTDNVVESISLNDFTIVKTTTANQK